MSTSSASSDPTARRAQSVRAQRIRTAGLALGFERIGFARAERHPHADRLDAWLADGCEADLGYMRRDPGRRSDPRQVVAHCRTIVVTSLGHWLPDAPSRADLPGRVARYAKGRDYHKIHEGLLKRLVRVLADESGEDDQHRFMVDYGPLLERSWAATAGIGFIGKNTLLIDPRRGSWSTLSAILTTLDIAPDAPIATSCGTCSRCLPACPTGAITEPGRVDARLCISYWTIEHRGTIPESLRASIGTRVFGCDDCQDVCPWNRFAQPTSVADHRPREFLADPDLARLALLTRDAWDDATRGMAVRRVGYEGLLRNVAVALGNTRDPRAAMLLAALSAHESELVREHAAWGLARHGVR